MELLLATLETLEMTLVSLVLSYLFGLPLAVITCETAKRGLFPNKIVHFICEVIISVGRAVPFVILMVLLLPVTRLLLGTGIGTLATIIPLTVASIPFVARMIEQSILKTDFWIIVAAKVDKSSKFKIIWKVKLGSQLYDIIDGAGVASVAIVGYTTMASVVGGGGLGAYAITNGFYRYDWGAVAITTVIIVVIVFALQYLFRCLSRLVDWRKK